MKFYLTSTCDGAGEMLAKRIEDPDFTRTVSEHDTKEAAEAAKAELLKYYRANNIPVGDGCLAIEAFACD